MLEETESRWVLGSAALPASGLTRPGLHPAPGTSGVDALGSRGQKIGVPGGELQPKSCCSDREHPERSCCSPRSSPLEGNAPSFLLPGSPPTLARTRGAHGHFSAKPFGGFGGWRGGPGGERLTGEEGDSSAGRRCHAGVPWLDANTQPGPLPGAGVGRDLDGRRLRVRNVFTGICHHLQTFFLPLSPRNNQGQGVHARACGQGKQWLGCAPVPRRSDGGLVPLLAQGGRTCREKPGEALGVGNRAPQNSLGCSPPPPPNPAAWAPHGERLRWERLRHH